MGGFVYDFLSMSEDVHISEQMDKNHIQIHPLL